MGAAAVSVLTMLAVAACGERHTTPAAAPGSAVKTPAAGADTSVRAPAPALARTPRRPGEVLVSGPASPRAHGPFRFHGRYTVRFEQADPEDPRQTFAAQTAFVAYAAPQPDQAGGPGAVRLARAAARTGTTTVRLDGRLWVNVSFGDFPYALRLTPAG